MVDLFASVDSVSKRFPVSVRQAMAADLVDPATEMGAGLNATIAAAPTATSTANGVMSATDKQRLDNLAANASLLFHTGVAWYEAGASAPDTYQAVNASGADAGLLSSNTGYARQAAGVAMNPQMQSRMRRCVLRNDGASVAYYLDCDNSAKIAGSWDATASLQSGWVRVHEGVFDSVRPIPGQTGTGNPALRAGVAAHDPARSYRLGERVLSGGSLWESLSDGNLGVTPASGTAAADLTGVAGQVMVEIPRFYCLVSYDSSLRRHSWEIVFDQAEVKPFPLLTDSPSLPLSKIVNGRAFPVHPAFTKAGVQRRARFVAAFGTHATDETNNGNGILESVRDGVKLNTTNVSLTNYTLKARNRNAGLSDPSGNANNVWQVVDNWLWQAVQLAYLTEYRTFYSQAVLGGGNQSGSDYSKIAGRSTPTGNASGSFDAAGVLQAPSLVGDFDGVQYRGLEDPWGTAWRRTAGGTIKNAPGGKEVYYSNTPASFVDTGAGATYALVASGVLVPAADGWQYATAIAPGTFLASVAGASGSTSTTDGTYLRAATGSDYNILLYGGNADNGSSGGFFAGHGSNSVANADVHIGTALAR